jgi:uncharacterized protein (DUF433 family)
MISVLDSVAGGRGLYGLREAAFYARMPAATLRAWFATQKEAPRVISSCIEEESGKFIGFLDFVEALAIRSLRLDFNIPLQKIRKALTFAKEKCGKDYLFARKDHRVVWDGRELFIYLDSDGNPTQATGRNLGQRSFHACIQQFLHDLEFDSDGVAKLYNADCFKDWQIVMEPNQYFGEPMVKGTGYTAESLYRAAVQEGGIEPAADVYEVDPAAVEAAYRYWDRLRVRVAA